MDGEKLEQIYQENLEERLISYLAKEKNVSLEQAMDMYYRSELCEKIHRGEEGLQYLDYRVLAQVLMKYEPEIFAK